MGPRGCWCGLLSPNRLPIPNTDLHTERNLSPKPRQSRKQLEPQGSSAYRIYVSERDAGNLPSPSRRCTTAYTLESLSLLGQWRCCGSKRLGTKDGLKNGPSYKFHLPPLQKLLEGKGGGSGLGGRPPPCRDGT